MNLSIQHTLLPGDSLSERFRQARAFGFAGVELAAWGFANPMPDHRAEIDAAVQASGLPVSSLCTMTRDDLIHPDPAERQKRLDGLVRILQLADAVGARGVIALPIRPPLSLPDLRPVADEDSLITQLLVATLQQALERTAGLRAAVFLEPLNRYEARYLRTVDHAAALCRALGSPRVQVMADLFHMSIEEASLAGALQAAAAHIGHVHLADSNRLLPGHGHTDFVAPFRALRQAGFSGWLALECRVTGAPHETLPAAARFLQERWEQAA